MEFKCFTSIEVVAVWKGSGQLKNFVSNFSVFMSPEAT